MSLSSITFSYPPEFILLCLLAGFFVALLLYRKKAPWSKRMNRLLFAFRWVLVTLLAILLLAPVLRQIQNYTEKPSIVLAVDNSQSVRDIYDSLELDGIRGGIDAMAQSLEGEGFIVDILNLSDNGEPGNRIEFASQRTNLDRMLQDIRNDYEGRNLQEVILLSDGIYNEGMSPAYRGYPFAITAVGLGDSTEKKDIRLETLRYNKIAYQGNKFPLIATIHQNGYNGREINVTVTNDGRMVSNQTVQFSAEKSQEIIPFEIDAGTKGMQRYTVTVEELDDEFIRENNSQEAYLEIIEGKQKVCIVAASPHPDLTAVTEALESNSNYDIEQYILSISEDRRKFMQRSEPTDLFILHQMPSASFPIDWEARLQNASVLYLYGPQMDLGALSALNPFYQIQPYMGEYDQVTAVFNPSFSPYTYGDDVIQMLPQFPPLVTPFGDVALTSEIQVMLLQRVGSIETAKPLLLTNETDDKKTGILMGSGIWKWKLSDYARNKGNAVFNELVQKLVQYLSSRADKRRFRLYPLKEQFTTGEDVVFEAEVYNELYERVFGNRISLTITSSEGEEQSFSYVTSEANSRYTVSGLDDDVYTYAATTELEGSTESVSGEFIVRKLNLESLNLTADFSLLRQLSDKSTGKFYTWEQRDQLLSSFSEKQARGIIFTEEKYLSAINLTWVMILLILLASTEWFLRKFYGSY